MIKINSSVPTHINNYYKLHKLLSSEQLVGGIQIVQKVQASNDDTFNYCVIRFYITGDILNSTPGVDLKAKCENLSCDIYLKSLSYLSEELGISIPNSENIPILRCEASSIDCRFNIYFNTDLFNQYKTCVLKYMLDLYQRWIDLNFKTTYYASEYTPNQELLNSIFKHKEVKYDKTFNNSDR